MHIDAVESWRLQNHDLENRSKRSIKQDLKIKGLFKKDHRKQDPEIKSLEKQVLKKQDMKIKRLLKMILNLFFPKRQELQIFE